MINVTENCTYLVEHCSQVAYPEWSFIAVIVFMVVIFLTGVPGNILIIVILIRLKSKFSTDYYIIMLAIVDLICTGINSPIYIARNIQPFLHITFSTNFCKVHSGFLYLTTMSSTLLLSVIAGDRYLVTCKPWNRFGRSWNIKALIVNIIIAGFSVGYATWIGEAHDYDPVINDCYIADPTGLVMSYILVVMFVMLFVTAVFCYAKICITLRAQGKLLKFRRMQKGTRTSSFIQRKKVSPLNNHCSKEDGNDLSISVLESVSIQCNYEGKGVPKQESTSTYSGDITEMREGSKHNKHHSEIVQTSNRITTGTSNNPWSRDLNRRNKRIALITFLLTTTYIVTWILNWGSYGMYHMESESALGAAHLIRKLFMINCAVNPMLYMILSSKFREKTRLLLAG